MTPQLPLRNSTVSRMASGSNVADSAAGVVETVVGSSARTALTVSSSTLGALPDRITHSSPQHTRGEKLSLLTRRASHHSVHIHTLLIPFSHKLRKTRRLSGSERHFQQGPAPRLANPRRPTKPRHAGRRTGERNEAMTTVASPTAVTTSEEVSSRTRLRAVLASGVGGVVEWYDYFPVRDDGRHRVRAVVLPCARPGGGPRPVAGDVRAGLRRAPPSAA